MLLSAPRMSIRTFCLSLSLSPIGAAGSNSLLCRPHSPFAIPKFGLENAVILSLPSSVLQFSFSVLFAYFLKSGLYSLGLTHEWRKERIGIRGRNEAEKNSLYERMKAK
jgi:hypothetical protein